MCDTNDDPILLNTTDAARLIGAKTDVLRISRKSGEIYSGIKTPPWIKLGRSVRYRRDDLMNWVERYASNRVTTTQPEN
jgi:predicted DNA-binding transcriptional regulator AlpA